MEHRIPNVLTIAGSDAGGGAGIQADLKTFAALGAYGASVVTALTAQNTHGVTATHLVPASMVAAQLDAVLSDIRIDAVKIGMLGNAEIVTAVATVLRRAAPRFLILDTVMLSTSGQALLDAPGVAALRDLLLPLATLVTPNLAEAATLIGDGEAVANSEEDMVRQAQALRALGARAVLIKGGHLPGEYSPDWLVDAQGVSRLGAARIATTATHGTGCTLSAAIAALRPQRLDLASAVSDAKTYVTQALLHADKLQVGSGNGPLHHFHHWW